MKSRLTFMFILVLKRDVTHTRIQGPKGQNNSRARDDHVFSLCHGYTLSFYKNIVFPAQLNIPIFFLPTLA